MPGEPIHLASPPAEKVALFRSLFRGREDVYPRRFESRRTGKSGYQPACGNEWIRGICEKPRIKCSECLQQAWLPVTDRVIRCHLSGKDEHGSPFVMGLYPMLLDESCFFLAVDFDGETWKGDAGAFFETCRTLDLPVALERSRSGKGGHVWLFFEEAVSAFLARKLGAWILTKTMENHPGLGMRSYDRFFPNQDTLPRGGFGNLIALPLQKQARDMGNTVFIDESGIPYPDQWVFLSSLRRISKERLESLLGQAERQGGVIRVRCVSEGEESPWLAPPSRRSPEPPIKEPMPKTLELVLGDQIYIPKENVPLPLRNRLVRLAAFQNPEFYRAQAMRLPVYDKPRIIDCAEDHPLHLSLPRGCLEEVSQLLVSLKIQPHVRDERCQGMPIDHKFFGSLRPDQEKAAVAMLAHETGVLAATTAFGKTVLAAWLIAKRGVNTLVLVHRQQLLEQWIERLSHFLDVPSKSLGRLGGGRKKLTGQIDVANIQSLVRKGIVDDRIGGYGHVIVDECHHLSAQSFELVARRAKARYVTGLSATVTRKDGHHPIIFMQCGPVRHRVDAKSQAAARPFSHHVLVRPTGYRDNVEPAADPRMEFQRLTESLAKDPARNRMICSDVVASVHEGRFPLVLTERTEHLLALVEMLSLEVSNVIALQGGMRKKDLAESLKVLEQTASSRGRVIVATGRFVGEGFDVPALDSLFITLPVSWRGTIAQYAGRLHRLHEGKREVRIFDYADLDTPMLSRMFDRRCQGYESIGYTILLPASALPGWPVEVPLPVSPQWKKDYAASIRRLILDGVDPGLAKLFVHATNPPEPEAEGEARARSASEVFLYRRLESLTETKGRFVVNANLPIPFDKLGKMEVDFLDRECRIVIELDGSQHLSDAEAYRRDRRKDELLQRNGYFVLRFLTEDIGKHLDHVLDVILAALVHRHHSHNCKTPF